MGDIAALWQQEQAERAHKTSHPSRTQVGPDSDKFYYDLPEPSVPTQYNEVEDARERERGFRKARTLKPGESILEQVELGLEDDSKLRHLQSSSPARGPDSDDEMSDLDAEGEEEEDDYRAATSGLPFVRESAPPPPSSPRPAHTIIFDIPSPGIPSLGDAPALVQRLIRRKGPPGPSPLSQSHLPQQESESDAEDEDERNDVRPSRYSIAEIPPYRPSSSLPPSLASHLLTRPDPRSRFPVFPSNLLPAVDILPESTAVAGTRTGLGFGALNVPYEPARPEGRGGGFPLSTPVKSPRTPSIPRLQAGPYHESLGGLGKDILASWLADSDMKRSGVSVQDYGWPGNVGGMTMEPGRVPSVNIHAEAPYPPMTSSSSSHEVLDSSSIPSLSDGSLNLTPLQPAPDQPSLPTSRRRIRARPAALNLDHAALREQGPSTPLRTSFRGGSSPSSSSALSVAPVEPTVPVPRSPPSESSASGPSVIPRKRPSPTKLRHRRGSKQKGKGKARAESEEEEFSESGDEDSEMLDVLEDPVHRIRFSPHPPTIAKPPLPMRREQWMINIQAWTFRRDRQIQRGAARREADEERLVRGGSEDREGRAWIDKRNCEEEEREE
ncbi:hypothetical protein B9479_007870 [Cryptococcus floricola]|uniref:Uncharacterized protein n=1 Tax=Cryptococcus floricola TaxID=2591691 RepID=A0A5D3AMY3_9TREE|nr:hypothetical protein B9479_007870 [Cryptococcus floricola]